MTVRTLFRPHDQADDHADQQAGAERDGDRFGRPTADDFVRLFETFAGPFADSLGRFVQRFVGVFGVVAGGFFGVFERTAIFFAEFVDDSLDLLAGFAGLLLDQADELIVLAFDLGQLIVGDLAPMFLDLALE